MALYLVQHGRSISVVGVEDPGLSEEGAAEVERIAEVAKNYGVRVSRIEHSHKERARQTAVLIAAALSPEQGVHERDGLQPLDDVMAIAGELCTEDGVMLVGHLPFMERLTAYLVTGSPERLIFKFQNGGIVCLDRNSDQPHWYIKWALMPRVS